MFEMETGVVTGWPLSQVIAAHLRARRAHLSPTPEKFDPGYLLVRILTVLCHPPPYYRSVFADELTSSASSFHQPSCLKNTTGVWTLWGDSSCCCSGQTILQPQRLSDKICYHTSSSVICHISSAMINIFFTSLTSLS